MTISVIICTRNRGDLIGATLRTVLAGTLVPDELLVVDQSDGGETQAAVEAFAADHPSVRYLATETRGLSRARNVGLELSRGDVLAFTDDDVLVHADWLERVAAEFRTYPRLAFLFGTVLPPEGYDWQTEFVPYVEVQTRRPVLWHQKEVFGGMGANMSLRRTAYERLGGFDEGLGAGTGLAGEDYEYALRVASHVPPLGIHLLDEARVVHHAGARSGEEYHKFVHQVNGTGMGQFWARCLESPSPRYRLRALLSLLQPFGGFASDLVRGRKPSGLRTYTHALRGFAQAIRRDRDSG